MEESKSILPRLSIKERMATAIKNPSRYSSNDLDELWTEWQEHIERLRVNAKEAKAKDKKLKQFEKAIEKTEANWKATLKMVGKKVKDIKFKKHKE